MRSLLFEQSQEDVCVEVSKSLQHQEQDPSPKISAGLSEEDGKMWGTSFVGPHAAKEQKSYRMSLRMLCLLILSPDTGQTEAW